MLDMLQTPKAAGIGGVTQQPRFSLLDGAYHANGAGEEGAQQEDSLALAKRAQQALQLSGMTSPCPQVAVCVATPHNSISSGLRQANYHKG